MVIGYGKLKQEYVTLKILYEKNYKTKTIVMQTNNESMDRPTYLYRRWNL